MNAIKKIFLLSLLSVFLLPAFSQNSGDNIEILAQITINRSADADEIGWELEQINRFPMWIPLYRWVTTDPFPNGYAVDCSGMGLNFCMPKLPPVFYRGVPNETVENAIEEMITDSGEQIKNGEYRGTISRKIVAADGQSFLLFQMNWESDPKNIRNGRTEIIISKINDFGVR
jgi:hypothetical protein